MFNDRQEAGRKLAERLRGYQGKSVVVGVPRGGLPVAAEIARRLAAPLDMLVSLKIPAPDQPDLPLGAVTARGLRVLHEAALAWVDLPLGYLEEESARRRALAEACERRWRGNHPAQALSGRTVVLVDDGVVTGMTMRAAIAEARAQTPDRLVVAVPAAAPEIVAVLKKLADEVVALEVTPDFYAVGQFYASFPEIEEDEVARWFGAATARGEKPRPPRPV